LGGLAQRLVRELGIPAVIGMSERVTIATAHALAEAFYRRLLAHGPMGEVDRALVEAYMGLANRPDVNVPALYSRLGTQPLFSAALDRELTSNELRSGLQQLGRLLEERAPVLQPRMTVAVQTLQPLLGVDPAALSATARQEREAALQEVNALCQEAVEVSFHALAQGEPVPAYDGRCPFRGLSAFQPEDREFFFGREALVDKLRQKLASDPFLPVLGPSGSGKSSLVLAGLIPALQLDDHEWACLRPGSDPVGALQGTLRADDRPSVLVIDQFEELFTLCPDEGQRRAFIDKLLKLADGGRRVVLTLRADFWGECAPYAALKERMEARQELVAPMNAAELRAAMEQQAAKVGLRFEADLSNTMLDEVAGEPGAMPLLQHALLELWKRRHGRWLRASEYRALGGVKQAIAQTADRLYDAFSVAEQKRVRDIFLRLTQLGEDAASGEEWRDTRRRVSLAELVPAGSDPGATRALVTRLADAALVVTNWNAVSQQEEVEVAHEALIRHWGRLRGWLNEDREFLLWRQRLSGLLGEWERAQESDEALLRGPLLIEAQKWFDKRSQDLSEEERSFINASRALRERLDGEEKERQKKQLEDAEKRAKEQKEAASKLRRLAWVLAAVALAAVGGAIFGFWQRNEAEIRKQDAEVAKAEAKRQEAIAKENANEEKTSRNAAEEQARIAATQRNAAEEQARRAEEQARIAECRRLAAESSSALTKYPQRSLLLAVEAVKVAQPLHGVRVVADEQSLREALGSIGGRLVARADGPITTVAISPDNRWVVTGSLDKTARVWDLSAKDPAANPVILRCQDGPVTAVAISPDNHWVVTGSWKTARLWDLSAKDPTANPVVLRGHDNLVTAVAISPDNHWVVTGSEDKTARLWDLSAKDPAANPVVLHGHEDWVRAVAVSPDNRFVVTGSDNTARLWDLSAKDPAASPIVLRGQDSAVMAVAISPDNRWVVTGSYDNTARLWDLSAKDPAANPVVLRGHHSAVMAVAISPDNRWVVTGSYDNTARLWDLSAKDPAANPVVLRVHENEVVAVAVSPDNHWLVTGSWDKTARLWDLSAKDSAANPVVLRGHEGWVNAVAISPDNHWVVTGSWTARLWDLSAKDPAANPVILWGQDGPVNAVAISPDNHWVVTGNWKTARLWDLSAKDPVANPVVLRGHDNLVTAVAISLNNRWLVTGSHDSTARLWDLGAPAEKSNPVILRGDEDWVTADWVTAVAISSDNRWVVTGRWKTARLWDLSAKDPAASPIVLRGHDNVVTAVAISPDNRCVVTGSADHTARLWDLSAKDPAAKPIVLRGHHGLVTAVAITPDNRWLVTGSKDKTARLWLLQVNDLMNLARIIVGRNFSADEWKLYFPGEKYRKTFPDLPGPD
jgi:WD40 repeat protein